jgi:purine nucleosidase
MTRDSDTIFVDSDNALGSARGDVDDGIAIAVLLRSGARVDALASVFGNASAVDAQRNNATLARLCGFAGPSLLGAGAPGDAHTEAAAVLAQPSEGRTILGLGPLSNVAAALELRPAVQDEVQRVICLGSNARSAGRWPPLWPFEFNFTKDRAALVQTLGSRLPVAVVPLDQAGRLRLRFSALDAIIGPLGAHLRAHGRRWWVRARRLKLRETAPVWDLVAVAYLLWPERFETRSVVVRAHPSGWLQYGAGEREVTLVVDYDPRDIWQRAVATLNGVAAAHDAA